MENIIKILYDAYKHDKILSNSDMEKIIDIYTNEYSLSSLISKVKIKDYFNKNDELGAYDYNLKIIELFPKNIIRAYLAIDFSLPESSIINMGILSTIRHEIEHAYHRIIKLHDTFEGNFLKDCYLADIIVEMKQNTNLRSEYNNLENDGTWILYLDYFRKNNEHTLLEHYTEIKTKRSINDLLKSEPLLKEYSIILNLLAEQNYMNYINNLRRKRISLFEEYYETVFPFKIFISSVSDNTYDLKNLIAYSMDNFSDSDRILYGMHQNTDTMKNAKRIKKHM